MVKEIKRKDIEKSNSNEELPRKSVKKPRPTSVARGVITAYNGM